MIKVKRFLIKSVQSKYAEPHSEIHIQPTNDSFKVLKTFDFDNQKDLQLFADNLRQTFEYLFPFGCIVLYKIQ